MNFEQGSALVALAFSFAGIQFAIRTFNRLQRLPAISNAQITWWELLSRIWFPVVALLDAVAVFFFLDSRPGSSTTLALTSSSVALFAVGTAMLFLRHALLATLTKKERSRSFAGVA